MIFPFIYLSCVLTNLMVFLHQYGNLIIDSYKSKNNKPQEIKKVRSCFLLRPNTNLTFNPSPVITP